MTHPSRPRHSPTLAAILSFLVPGLGQLFAGRPRRGLLLLAPLAALVVGALVLAAAGRGAILGLLVRPEVLLGAIVLDVLLFAWRAAAIVDAWRSAAGGRVPRDALSTIVVAALVLVTGATHLVIGTVAYESYDTLTSVVSGDEGFGTLPDDSPVPTAVPTQTPEPAPGSTAAPTPVPTPSPTPVADPLADGRVDILLVGGDAGPGRYSLRTDTLVLLSIDVASGRAALFGIPRNMVNVPLPRESRSAFRCGCFPQLINALYVYASGHPGSFPGKDDTRGLRAVQLAIGELTGLRLDGMVVVKLQGFVKLIDAIGGLDIVVPESVYDSHYPLENGRGSIVLSIKAGRHHFDGRTALAYARSRHQDSDYGRMERQQITLAALGRELTSKSLLDKLPELLDIAKNNLWTNLKLADLPALVELSQRVDLARMKRYMFVPPRYPEYVGKADVRRIQAVVAGAFKQKEPTPTPRPTPPFDPGPWPTRF